MGMAARVPQSAANNITSASTQLEKSLELACHGFPNFFTTSFNFIHFQYLFIFIYSR